MVSLSAMIKMLIVEIKNLLRIDRKSDLTISIFRSAKEADELNFSKHVDLFVLLVY